MFKNHEPNSEQVQDRQMRTTSKLRDGL